jgi:hypothetical protein
LEKRWVLLFKNRAARDWPQAIAPIEGGHQALWRSWRPTTLKKDIGLIYCRSGDLKHGRAELLEAQKLDPEDSDIRQALRLLENANQGK